MLSYVIHFLFWIALKMVKVLYIPLWFFYIFQRPKRCPAVYAEIYLQSAVKLADNIRKQEVTSVFVVEAYIMRAKEVNKILNAIVEDRFELAMQEAKYVDEFIKTCGLSHDDIEKIYPLLGVPITIKESVALEGMSNASTNKATEDAPCVRQLKAAGAIPILVSNTPDYCLNWETYNTRTGRTLNPYDTRKTCGGSSGGEAVLLASCGSIIGVGSDAVGSLRLPPTFCGVYGHKPTPDLVDLKGHQPIYANESDAFSKTVFTFGPLARYATDLPLLLTIMMKPEKRSILKLYKKIDVKNIKIFYMEHNGGNLLTNHVHREIVASIQRVVRHLKDRGCNTEKLKIELMSDVDLCFVPLLSMQPVKTVLDEGKTSVLKEVIRSLFGCSTVIPTVILHVWIRAIFNLIMSEERIQKNFDELAKLKDDLMSTLGNSGVLIYPAFPNVAHLHGQIYSRFFDTSYLGIFNTLGFPVTICPVGLGSKGLPISIQLVTTPNNDRLTLTLARELEETYGSGWVSPPFKSGHTP